MIIFRIFLAYLRRLLGYLTISERFSFSTIISISLVFIGCSDYKSEVLYRINDGKLYGFVDSGGKVVIQPKFTFASSFQEDLSLVLDSVNSLYSQYCFIDKKGEIFFKSFPYSLTPKPLDLHPILKRKIDISSLKSLLAHTANEFSFSNGLALIYDDTRDRFGYLNKRGKVSIEPQFTNATKFKEGYAVVQTSFDSSNWENTHVGIIDSTGKFTIPSKYYQLTRMSHNLAIGTMVTKASSTYTFTSVLLNEKGNIVNTVTQGDFSFFDDYSGGYASGYSAMSSTFFGKGYFFIDSAGAIIKNPKDGSELYFQDAINNNGKYFWFKNKEGYAWFKLDKSVIKFIDNKVYDTVKAGFNKEGIACVKFAKPSGYAEYGFIDTLGNFIITPRFYDASNFNGPLAAASLKSGRIYIVGYINRRGTFVWSREVRDSTH